MPTFVQVRSDTRRICGRIDAPKTRIKRGVARRFRTPTEVRNVLDRHLGHHLLEFTDNPEALEWRQSQNDQRSPG
jgi:hypothetical protein